MIVILGGVLIAAMCGWGSNSPGSFAHSAEGATASKLRAELKDISIADHWIYDDLPKAVAEAKETGKPLLVVLRCVPCPPGRSLDEKVMRPDAELEKLEKQFVCVRVVQTNSLDLKVFQYDYDMSWAAMFLNADLTVYGRYGTRKASGPQSDTLLSPTGFRKALERALELHKGYPDNKAQLAGKTGQKPDYARPTEIPGLKDKPATATTRQACIHCHMVKEYALRAKWEQGALKPEDIYVYPLPEQIGLTMDVEDGLKVKTVAANSPAGKAGIAAGDEITALGGQPLVSTADIQWVLHGLPKESRLQVELRRGDAQSNVTVSLAGDWKQSDIAWRASSWYGLRQGVKFDPLPAAEKKKRGIEEGDLALVIRGLFGKGGPKVQQAGLRPNDVIISVNGKSKAMNESEFLAYLRLEHGPKDSIKLTILRGEARRELEIPLW
jgi:hypothetical protein